jgi:hypothetical protein
MPPTPRLTAKQVIKQLKAVGRHVFVNRRVLPARLSLAEYYNRIIYKSARCLILADGGVFSRGRECICSFLIGR